MLNLHQNVICPSEEPFALYFYNTYKNKTQWSETELNKFIDRFWLVAEKNLNLFFTSKKILFDVLQPFKNNLNYHTLCNLIYLQFLEPKVKTNVNVIVDKQIKYFFSLKKLIGIFPNAKFIILARDPRVNAIRKISRNLNISQHPLFLTALWNNTYQNIHYLLKKNKAVHIVRYEDLVSEPKKILKEICLFINVTYSDGLVETEGVYESFLNTQKDKITPAQLGYLKNFQSSLYQKINTEKIHLKHHEINVELNDKIVKVSENLLNFFRYESGVTTAFKKVTFNLNDRFQLFKAYLYRPLFIKLYIITPLAIKLIIKKIKNKLVYD